MCRQALAARLSSGRDPTPGKCCQSRGRDCRLEQRPAAGLEPQFICQAGKRELTLRHWRAGPPGDGVAFGQFMHELSIMQSALSQALDQARQAGAVRVHEIRLRVGALSGVIPDALQFAFEALADGTLAEGARLTIEHVPARFWCATCNREFEAGTLFAECPDCHHPSGKLCAGRELELASLEID